jgi:glutamine synthetase
MLQNTNYKSTNLTTIITTDLAGITRGCTFPANMVDSYTKNGCNWLSLHSLLTPQDRIVKNNSKDFCQNLLLMPDVRSTVKLTHMPDSEAAIFEFVHGNIVNYEGDPWSCCTRTVLNNEINHYHTQLGLQIFGDFDHEFNVAHGDFTLAHQVSAFSLHANRHLGNFSEWVINALNQTGIFPEVFLPKLGKQRYGITCRAANNLDIIDKAVNTREIIREVARQYGLTISFSPKITLDSISNLIHLRISLQDMSSQPILYDSKSKYGLSEIGQHWVAGIIHYLPALCALTKPSPISYLEMKENNKFAFFGHQNPESVLRVNPVNRFSSMVANLFNLEFNLIDATANLYLAMTGILIAGRLGIEKKLPLTACLDVDPLTLPLQELNNLAIRRLPTSLHEALEMLRAETEFTSQLPEALLNAYYEIKQHEIALTKDLTMDQLCEQYRTIY